MAMLLSTSSTTISPTAVGGQLLLRGTRDSQLAATLLSHPPLSASTSAPATSCSSIRPSERMPLFTWAELIEIVSSGNLQKLSRHPDDLRDYFTWMDKIKKTYGSVSAFLIAERFTATYLLETPSICHDETQAETNEAKKPNCFQSSFVPGKECQILVNDWPYSVPIQVTHFVVWSYLPILHPDLVQGQSGVDQTIRDSAWTVIAKRGLCGTLSPHSGLRIPTLADHKLHLADLASSLPDNDAENQVETLLFKACSELVNFIQQHWDIQANELAFFANPPSLQSVPALAHFHVLVKPL